jgi:hypothetical protein
LINNDKNLFELNDYKNDDGGQSDSNKLEKDIKRIILNRETESFRDNLIYNYVILKASYSYEIEEGKFINLETYLPIAIKNSENVINITGAS